MKDLLDVNVSDPILRLSRKDVYLGPKVEEFLVALGLTRSSPELGSFFKGIYNFYVEAGVKALKYFGPALESVIFEPESVDSNHIP